MTELVNVILELIRQGEDLVLARVIGVKGSSPREVGAAMAVRKNSEIVGTIGGGLIEAAAMKKAQEIFVSGGCATLEFDMTGDDLKTADMVCGGTMEVLVELLAAAPETVHTFAGINENRRHSRTSYLVTDLPGVAGVCTMKRRLLSAGGLHEVPLMPDPLEEAVYALAEPAVISVDGRRYWVDVIRPGGIIYIMGAGHISREVSELAQRVGFMTVVMDDRPEYANRERFGKQAEVVVLKSFDDCFEGVHMDDNGYIVIVTRGHIYDKVVLGQALKTGAGYVGMIGSIRKRDTIYRSLMEDGFAADQIGRVHCPIGLKMDSETPAEIAVSIVGELINVRAEKRKWAVTKSPR